MKQYTVTETAKIVRNYLKEQFPDTKFSVRTERYSGANNIKIIWTDGIAKTKVQEVTRRFARNNEFAQEVLGDRAVDTWENEKVIWGADIVKWEREITEDFKDFISYIFDAGCLSEFLKEEWQPYFKAWEVYKDIDNDKESWDYPRLKNNYIHQIIDQFSSDDFQDLAYFRDEDLSRISELNCTVKITLDRSTKQAKWLFPDNSDGLVKGEFYTLLRVTSFICRIGGDSLPNHLEYGWEYQGIYYADECFQDKDIKQFADYDSEPVAKIEQADLVIEGITVKGKIADYIQANNLQSENLESILDRFYSQPKTEYLTSEYGDRFQIIETDSSIQFSFESSPTPYVTGLLETRGFQGTGTIYQRELNKIAVAAKDSVMEALNCG